MPPATRSTDEALVKALEEGDVPLALTLVERRDRELRAASAAERAVAQGFDRVLLERCTELLSALRRERGELGALRARLAALPRSKRSARFIDRRV